ncbi:MAG TPA: ester cyclase [Solirubrobacteraceae bacterium]|nr:ester cyclase [Solirubrobacteraceae bacterium]
MDIIDRHFAAENAHDVRATLETYTEDVVWDDVGNPACPVEGKAATSGMYEGIMAAIPDLHIASVMRFGDAEHVVDEAIATGHVEGAFLGVDGGGAPVRFRMLHVFDLRDGLICREQAWFDTAGVLRQIEAHRT